ncbi:MAG: rod-binding protein [Leptospirillia bacterium]
MDPFLSMPGALPGNRPAHALQQVAGKAGGVAPGGGADNARAAREMEALFVAQLIKAMRSTVPEKGLLSGGRGEEVMQTLQDEALAQSIARRGDFGLAEQVLDTLNRINPQGPGKGAASGDDQGNVPN